MLQEWEYATSTARHQVRLSRSLQKCLDSLDAATRPGEALHTPQGLPAASGLTDDCQHLRIRLSPVVPRAT